MVGIEEEAEAAGLNLLLLTAAKDALGCRSLYPQGTNGMQLADGGVLIGWDEREDEVRRLAAERFPFVFLGRRDYDGLDLSYVAADYSGATEDLTARVLAAGRHPGFVDAAGHVEPAPGRAVGYRAAMEKAGRPARIITVESAEQGQRIAQVFRDAASLGVDTLLVEDDLFAHALTSAVAEEALDLDVLSLGGAPDAGAPGSLRGIRIPRREMGREAVRLLIALLADPAAGPRRSSLPCV